MPIALTPAQRNALYELIEHGRHITSTVVRKNLVAKGLLVDSGEPFEPQKVTDAAYSAMGWAVPGGDARRKEALALALAEIPDKKLALAEMSDAELDKAVADLCTTFDATFSWVERNSLGNQIAVMRAEQAARGRERAIEQAEHTPFITDGINPGTARGACSCGWLAPATRVTVKAARNDIGFHLAEALDIEDRR